MKWNNEVNFDMQEKTNLTDAEKQMIEQYIDNSEPPMGVSLNSQIIKKLYDMVNNYISESLDLHGFSDLAEVTFAGREGSNHPHRSNARRVMEYGDAVYNILDQITGEIIATREDIVKPLEDYAQHIPAPTGIPDHQNR